MSNFYCLLEPMRVADSNVHLDHWHSLAPIDTYCRYKRMKEYNVLQPFGFNTFCLSVENNAIRKGVSCREFIENNIDSTLDQVWEMESEYNLIDPLLTSDISYYQWVQWVFLQLYKNGLIYKGESLTSYCRSCCTSISDDCIKNERCTLCNSYVYEISMTSWLIKVSEYADELYNGLNDLKWPREIIQKQQDYIGEDLTGVKDWNISRQRFWGCPIPIVYDPDGNPHPVPEDMLPWRLPFDVELDRSTQAVSPLVKSEEFIDRTERAFGKGWRPEFETIDSSLGKSIYPFICLMSGDSDKFADKRHIKEWLPVDLYVTSNDNLHIDLLYSRFINLALFNMGHSAVKEPFKSILVQENITHNGVKMHRDYNNVIDVEPIIRKYGPDALRLSVMLIGSDGDNEWRQENLDDMIKLMNRIRHADSISKLSETHVSISKNINLIEKAIEKMEFDAAIYELIQCLNDIEELDFIPKTTMDNFIKVFYPFAPMLAQELRGPEIIMASWPNYMSSNVRNDLVVQIDGQFVGTIKPKAKNYNIDAARSIANLTEDQIQNIIYVEGKMINFVTKKKDKT